MAASKKKDVIVEEGAVYILRAGIPVYVKTADICAMTGKTNQWIGQLTAQGILSKRTTPHGSLFEAAATMQDYCSMLENRVDSDGKTADEKKVEATKRAAEAALKASKATIAKLEAQELQGKMHRSEDVEAMTTDLLYTIRSALIALPGRVAVDLAALNTPAETADYMRKAVNGVLNELAQYRYDPKKYEELVRGRRAWEMIAHDEDED